MPWSRPCGRSAGTASPTSSGGTAPGERGRRLGFGCPRWQLRRQGGRGGPGQPRGRGRNQCWAVPAGVPGADPPGRSRPGSWSLGSRGRPCRPSVATWSATTCATPARCMGCSRSSLACCSGYIWARGSPCTRQRSTSWPPAGSGRAACCNHHRPTPTHPPQRLTLPTNSNPDPEEATRADVTAPPTSTPTRRTQRCRCRLPAPARHRPGTLVAGRLPMWRAPVVALECLCGQAACAGVGWGLGSGSGSSGIGRTGVSAPGRLADGWVSWPGWLVGPLSQ
jgi:hypothetical protein